MINHSSSLVYLCNFSLNLLSIWCTSLCLSIRRPYRRNLFDCDVVVPPHTYAGTLLVISAVHLLIKLSMNDESEYTKGCVAATDLGYCIIVKVNRRWPKRYGAAISLCCVQGELRQRTWNNINNHVNGPAHKRGTTRGGYN